MNEYKILFTGTMGAGKTTAIAAVSETEPIVTDVQNSDQSIEKKLTTVGLDFGSLTLESGDRVRLFGTPGQSRFDFLWKILAKNALGLIILTDNSREDPLADLQVYLEGFSQQLASLPCAIGIGRTETHPSPNVDNYMDLLDQYGHIFPILEVDVRRRSDVVLLIDTLLAQLEVISLEDED